MSQSIRHSTKDSRKDALRTMLRAARRAGAAVAATVAGTLALCGPSFAQAPAPGTDAGFDVLGYIQEATVDNCSDALCGGSVKVNGHRIVIPANTIVVLPGTVLTWKELFTLAPAPYKGISSGLALADLPAPLASYEAHIIGNQVDDQYIAGLVTISQQSLNSGIGFINYIDYTSGEIRVGGRLIRDGSGVPLNQLDPSKPGIRLRLNDPVGRFGRPTPASDVRFTVDADNPTIRSVTGYPMCIPRYAPTAQKQDPACPEANRPKEANGQYSTNFTMPDPAALAQGQLPDPRLMAPLALGDSITYSGTLVSDGGPNGPYGAAGNTSTYIAAHTLVSNVAIYTAPFTDPAYVAIDVSILGNGGVSDPNNLEATVRTRFEGFTTDPSRNIHLYAVDVAPDGTTSDRDWGIVSVDPGAPTGAQKGRWRFRPPCTGLVASVNFCFGPLDENTFLPAPREVRAVVEFAWSPSNSVPLANGLIPGQYHAPIAEYLFQENLPGATPPATNFGSIPFLAKGGYSSATGVVANGPLHPWPGTGGPPTSCTAPSANAGSNMTVQSGKAGVQLDGSGSGSGSLTYSWAPPPGIILSSTTVPNPTFTAPAVAAPNTYLFTLTVTGCGGQTATSSVSVRVEPPANAPFIQPISAQTAASGQVVVINAVAAAGPNKLSYAWTQMSGPTVPFQTSNGGATLNFTRAVPAGQTTSDVLTFMVQATDTVTNAKSAPVTVTVTVIPGADIERITVATYRLNKSRIDMTVVSSVVSPNLVLKLQPYRTTTGALFDPATVGNTFTNVGSGTYTITINGAPQPGIDQGLVTRSNLGGQSLPVVPTLR